MRCKFEDVRASACDQGLGLQLQVRTRPIRWQAWSWPSFPANLTARPRPGPTLPLVRANCHSTVSRSTIQPHPQQSLTDRTSEQPVPHPRGQSSKPWTKLRSKPSSSSGSQPSALPTTAQTRQNTTSKPTRRSVSHPCPSERLEPSASSCWLDSGALSALQARATND